jgi:hypothetical protein
MADEVIKLITSNENHEALLRMRSLDRDEVKLLLETDLLHIAAERHDIEMIDLLISLGDDVNRKSSFGLTPMRVATHPFSIKMKGKPTDDVPLLLIKHGAVVLGDVLEYAIAFNLLKLIDVLADTILTQPQMKNLGLSWDVGGCKYSVNTQSTKRDTCILCYAINLSIEYGNRMALDRFLNAHIAGEESWWRGCYNNYDDFSIQHVMSYGLYRSMRGVNMFQLYVAHNYTVCKPDYDGCVDVFLEHGADPLSPLPFKRSHRANRALYQRLDEFESPIHHLTRVSERTVMKMLTTYSVDQFVLADLLRETFKQNMTVAFEWCIGWIDRRIRRLRDILKGGWKRRFDINRGWVDRHVDQQSIEILGRERARYLFELIDDISELTRWDGCPRDAMYMLDLLLISGVNMKSVYSLDASRTAMPFLYAKSINIPNGFITHLLSFHQRITLRRIALFNIRSLVS